VKLRLLPDNPEISWVPYVWLVYLSGFLAHPGMKRASPLEWTLTLVATAAFLALYFYGFWVRGWRLVAVAAGIDLLGVLFGSTNPGALAFFIYGAAMLARVGDDWFALRLLIAHLVLILAGAAVLGWSPIVWGFGSVFSSLIGGVNLHYAGVSRANARLRMAQEEVEHLATVAERERIARDLHDLLGHTLSVIILKSELAAKLAERDPRRAGEEIREVERVSREALAEVRAAVRGYRTRGLPDELLRARRTLEDAGLTVECDAGSVALDAAREGVLALALREAVTNVIRHSGARSCRMRLREDAGRALLEVHDDGRGGLAPEGIGLTGMRERIQALGGTLERDGSAGTRLVIRLPLKGLTA
jgi:two-component system sensor histidine kinase DesK